MNTIVTTSDVVSIPFCGLYSFPQMLSGAKSCFLIHLKEWQVWQMGCFRPCRTPHSSAITTGDEGTVFEPSFTFGGHKSLVVTFLVSCLLIWQEIFPFHGK